MTKLETRIAIVMGRGVEGCGVTRFVTEHQQWARKQGFICDVYAMSDKRWGREKSHEIDFIPFKGKDEDECKSVSKKLNEDYELVFYDSVPGSKGVHEKAQENWFKYIVQGVKPYKEGGVRKIMFQHDHKKQSLYRNYRLWDTVREMDLCMTHSMTSDFADLFEKNLGGMFTQDIKLIPFRVGMDFDNLKRFGKNFSTKKDRVSYLGRFAGFKHPEYIYRLVPYLKDFNIVTEMRGIERSIGCLPIINHELANMDFYQGHPVKNMEQEENVIQDKFDKTYIFGAYLREHGLEEVSKSKFGLQCYEMDKKYYGEHVEYSALEIVAVGSIPIFSQHWADHVFHRNLGRFSNIPCSGLLLDVNNEHRVKEICHDIVHLSRNEDAYERYQKSCYEVYRTHCDSKITFKRLYNDVYQNL